MTRALPWVAGTAAALFLLLPLLAPLAAPMVWDAPLRDALATALVTAAVAAALALVLGAPAAFGLWRADPPLRIALLAALALPLLLPPAIWAAPLRVLPQIPVPLAHALAGAPLVALTGWLALRRIAPGTLCAAAALGLPPRLIRRRLILPRALPAIGAGALLAAALSLGESVVAPALAAPGRPALSRLILDAARQGAPPTVAAGAAALLLALAVLLLAAAALRRSGPR